MKSRYNQDSKIDFQVGQTLTRFQTGGGLDFEQNDSDFKLGSLNFR